jgi:hypothetical protein
MLQSLLSARAERRNVKFVGSEVLTAVVMKSTVFWDITPCSLLKANRSFEGTCSLHLQGQLCFPPAFTLVSCSDYFST